MADPVTTNLVMAQPIRASDVGTWDVPVNGNTGILDSAFGSVTLLAPTNANITLLTSQAQNAIIRLTGALTANVAIILPSIYKFWTMDNQLTNSPSSFAAVLQSTSGTIQIGIPPGTQDVFYDGTTVNYRNLGRIGEYWDYVGSIVPSWVTLSTKPPYLNCNGTAFSTSVYPILGSLIGSNILPDSQAKYRVTLNQGSITPISTASGGSFTASSVAVTGGAQTTTLSSIHVPPVPINDPGHTHTYGFPNTATFANTGSGGDTFNAQVTQTTGAAVTNITAGNLSPVAFSALPPSYVGGITMIRAA